MIIPFIASLAAVALSLPEISDAVSQDVRSAILLLSGASVVEELSEEEMEKYRRFAARPLDLNSAGFSRLNSCGLLTEAQAASILAARMESGDILSWTELSLLPGFSSEYVEALRCFSVLRSSRAPGQREDRRMGHELMVRGMMKTAPGETDYAGGLKYAFNYGERAGINWATRNTYSDSSLEVGTVSAAWYGRRSLGKIVAGDLALRFGQGLAVWTGFSLSGLSTIQSYRRSPTGISQTSSFSSEHKGIGLDFNFFGRSAVWVVSSALSVSGKLPVLNVSRVGRSSTFGLTATSEALSADFRIGVPSVSIFGEICRNFQKRSLSAVCGVIWIPEYGKKFGAVARYADGKLQPAAGYEGTKVKLNFEGKVDYGKRTEMYKLVFATGDSLKVGFPHLEGVFLKPAVRLAGKYKPQESVPFRTDLRLDVDMKAADDSSSNILNVHLRADLEYSRAFSWQTYLEAVYSRTCPNKLKVALSARAGVFMVDNWDDRIYVYERDLPGTFTCPALYGRGFKAFLAGSVRFPHGSAVSMKFSTTRYFIDKPSCLELKLQYSLEI